jgi:hypothetical protein
MKKLSKYIIIIIGNYLTINEVIMLAGTWKRFRYIFDSYYSFYERECRSIFTSSLEIFRNLLLSSKSIGEEPKKAEPSFMLKCNSSESWKNMIMIGLNLKAQWRAWHNTIAGMEANTLSFVGNALLEALKSPDLSVPALLKEDNWVEFHSSFQQFIYEYLFRQQDIQTQGKPKVVFFHLTQEEEHWRQLLEAWVDEAYSIAEEIIENEERSLFFRLRWYSWENVNFM